MYVNQEIIHQNEYSYRKMRKLILGSKVRRIEPFAFGYCANLEELIIPEGVEVMKDSAFFECKNVRRISIPSTATQIETDAFWFGMGNSLEEISVHPDNPCYQSVDGVLYTKDGKRLVQYPRCRIANTYTIRNGVEVIGDGAFAYADQLQHIHIPDGVITIEGAAFEWCEQIEEIRIPDSVSSIGGYAFICCGRLRDIQLPKRMKYWGHEAFANCTSMTAIRVPDGVTQLDYAVLGGCDSLVSVSLPDSLTEINNSAFIDDSKLRDIHIPFAVNAIWEKAFMRCVSLESINIPPDIWHITEDAFAGCDKLNRVILEGREPDDMDWVPKGAELVRLGQGKLRVKRVYEPYSVIDGIRLLVDGLWPRGIKKEDLWLDGWRKEIAPSAQLRKAFHHGDIAVEEFSERYGEELNQSKAAAEFKAEIATLLKRKNVTLLYASVQAEFNNAVVLAKWLTV